MKKWYNENKEKSYKRTRQWQKENKEKVNANSKKYQQLRKNAEGSHTLAEFKALLRASGDRCIYCGSDYMVGRDHIVPLSRGGSNSINNLQILCCPCNSRKGTKIIDYRS